MTATFTARTPADLLSAIPAMAGYTPRNSIVILPLCGKSSAGLFRFDLPPGDPAEFAATAMAIVCRLEEADSIIAVVYAQDVTGDALHDPFEALSDAMYVAAGACGIELRDFLVVLAEHWFVSGQTISHPIDGLPAPPVADVPKPLSSQTSGTALPRVSARRKSAIRAAYAQACATVTSNGIAPPGDDPADPTSLPERLRDATDIIEDSITDPSPTAETYALLLWLLIRPATRDVALAQWCHGQQFGDVTLREQLDWLAGTPMPARALFLMGDGPVPDAGRLRIALERVRLLSACAQAEDRAGPLACAAWLSWALGMASHATIYARRALQADPQHGLSEIILSMCNAGHVPAWAFAPENRRRPR